MRENQWHIKGGRVVCPVSRADAVMDVYVDDGRISFDGKGADWPVIDASGLLVVPGLTDLHVHFREPGNEDAETIETGSAAAAAGGFTVVAAMPNTTPPIDSATRVHALRRASEASGLVDVLPVGCLTEDRRGGKVADLRAMRDAGAVAFSDDGNTVVDIDVMREAMRLSAELGVPVLDHAIDPVTAADGVMHEGKKSREYGLPGVSSGAEAQIVARDIELCRETGCAVHIQHVSAAESVAHLRAAAEEGLPVTAEVTPHHLALVDDDVDPGNPDYKMSPPLRSARDRESLLSAVMDGIIGCVATDHAPHTSASKSRGFIDAPCGVVGLETAVGVSYTELVLSGRLDLLTWLGLFIIGPNATLGRTPPSVVAGAPADLALLDVTAEWTVAGDSFLSRSRNSPFEGRQLVGRAVSTLRNGLMTWDGRGCR